MQRRMWQKSRLCLGLLLCKMVLKCDLLMSFTNAFAWTHKVWGTGWVVRLSSRGTVYCITDLCKMNTAPLTCFPVLIKSFPFNRSSSRRNEHWRSVQLVFYRMTTVYWLFKQVLTIKILSRESFFLLLLSVHFFMWYAMESTIWEVQWPNHYSTGL